MRIRTCMRQRRRMTGGAARERRHGRIRRHAPTARGSSRDIIALKKGAHLLKCGKTGKPKFCPFRLSSIEQELVMLKIACEWKTPDHDTLILNETDLSEAWDIVHGCRDLSLDFKVKTRTVYCEKQFRVCQLNDTRISKDWVKSRWVAG